MLLTTARSHHDKPQTAQSEQGSLPMQLIGDYSTSDGEKVVQCWASTWLPGMFGQVAVAAGMAITSLERRRAVSDLFITTLSFCWSGSEFSSRESEVSLLTNYRMRHLS